MSFDPLRRPRIWAALVLTAAAGWAPAPVAATPQVFGWTPQGFVDPAAGEAQRGQIAIDDRGRPVAVWSGRTSLSDRWHILYSVYDAGAATWSAARSAFSPHAFDDLAPLVSRAPDGTLWLAWLRHDPGFGGLTSTLMGARFADDTWSVPEAIATELAAPPGLTESWRVADEFWIAAVSQDSVWAAFAKPVDLDAGYADRDLYTAARSASGWSAPLPVAQSFPDEERPVLVLREGASPVVFYGLRDDPSQLLVSRWDGAAWLPAAGDTLAGPLFFEHAAAADTSGAVRVVAMIRETGPFGTEDRIREILWDPGFGFRKETVVSSAPATVGEPPDWRGLSLARAPGCPTCRLEEPPRFRIFWVDFTQPGQFLVLSVERRADGFQPFDSPGDAFRPDDAYPNGAHDPVRERWYAVWTAPPTSVAQNRVKFAYTADFVGELAIGGSIVAPDTVRLTVQCSGDASARTFRIFRLSWIQPEAPPDTIPASATPLPVNPLSGPCPLPRVDDRPGPGSWYYYVELEAQGGDPGQIARSRNFVISPNGGGGAGTTTQLLAPRPRPAVGAVMLPFELGQPGEVILSIYDLRGRLVREFRLGALAARLYDAASAPLWTGADERGTLVPGGMYFVRMAVDGRTIGDAERIVLLHGR